MVDIEISLKSIPLPGVLTLGFCSLCCVLYFVFHALLCLLSFKCLLCSSLCLPLSVGLFPPCFLLCAPPPHYLTWPPLSSPVPRLVISVCVFSLWLCPNSGAASFGVCMLECKWFPQMPPSFPSSLRTHCYYPSWLQTAQDSLCAQREETNK